MLEHNKALYRDPPFKSCATIAVAALALYLIGATGTRYWLIQRNAYQDTARRHLGILVENIRAYSERQGDLPEDEAAFRKTFLTDATMVTDPWNSTYRFRRDGDEFVVWSLGPDRIDGTDDDISAP